MKLGRAILVGVIGAVIVFVIVWITGRVVGVAADLASLTAAALVGQTGGAAWVAGFVAQLLLGACAAIVYAAIFEWVTERSGAWIGLAIAIAHVIVAGLVVGFLPGERLIEAGVMPPGAFYEYRGPWCIAAFVVAHLVFGWFVGITYGATRQNRRWVSRPWAEVPRS